MSRYPWPIAGEAATAADIFSGAASGYLPGVARYSLEGKMYATLAELLAGGAATASNTINASAYFTSGTTKEQAITQAIATVVALGLTPGYVFIPASMLPYDPRLVTFNNVARMIREGGNPLTFDILAYGAQASLAVADAWSTTGIQAALDAQHAAGLGKVWMPAGNYAISNLKYYKGSQIEGEGFVGPTNAPGTMLVQGFAAAIMLQPASTAATLSGFRFQNFGLSSFGNANNLGGLDVTNCSDYVVEDVLINGAAVFGVRVIGGNVNGDSGFGHFTRVIVNGHQSGAYAWIIGSSATDQPDGLTFTDCRTSSATGTWIHYLCTSGRSGPGSGIWKGCTFEAQGGNATTDVTVDAAGAGPNAFIGCRFENTGTGGVQVTLNGFGIQPFGWFIGCNWAPGSGGFTFVDNGPVKSTRFAELNGASNSVLYQILGSQTALKTVLANYQIVYDDHTILSDATAGNMTVTLPTPSAAIGSAKFYIKKIDSSANTVTIAPAGPNIDGGGASLVLDQQNQGVELQTDGTNWFVVSAHGISYTVPFENKAFAALYWGPKASGNYLQIDGTPKFNWSLGGAVQLSMDTSGFTPAAAGGKSLGTPALPFGQLYLNAMINDGAFALTWGASVAVNARSGDHQTLTATSNIAATVAAPTNPPAAGQSQLLTIEIFNNSGGALTTPVAFATGAGAFLTSGGVSPGSGLTIEVTFRFDQSRNRWIEVTRGAAV